MVCRRSEVDDLLNTMLVKVFPKRSSAGGGKEEGAQGEDALGSFTGPWHAAAAEAGFDEGSAGGFGDAAADGHGGTDAVIHPRHVVGEVGGGGLQYFDA